MKKIMAIDLSCGKFSLDVAYGYYYYYYETGPLRKPAL
jgi:hypothetical protein